LRIRVALLACLSAGCYHYSSVETTGLEAGSGVRARISPAAAERIAPLLGTRGQRVLTGTVVDRNSSGLIVEVPTAAQQGIEGSTQTLYQRITLAPADVVEIERRTLDTRKTALIVGGVTAVALSVVIKQMRGGPGIDSPPTSSGGNESRVPILRFHF
jgi:hypothetical protein